MQAIDWNALVPIGGAELATSIASFMALSVVGGILIFRIGLLLGPALFRTIGRVVADKPVAEDLASTQVYNVRGMYVDNMEIGSPYYFAEHVSREPDDVDEAIERGRKIRRDNYWNRPGRAEEDRRNAEHWIERWG